MGSSRQRMKDALDEMVGGMPAAEEKTPARTQPGEPQAVSPRDYWRKQTVPYRAEQLARLEALLARWKADLGVTVTTAEVLRLALDKLLEEMGGDPDEAILELYYQERREQKALKSRKFGRSKGAEAYLIRKGKL